MHVAGHKNARLGPAAMYMSTNLYTNIKAYILNVRPSFANPNTHTVFVKANSGTAFKEGKIGKRVTEWWVKAKNLRVSTKMRKMAASTLHHTEETNKRAVHRLMTHKPSTAEKYYMIDNLNEAAERGALVLRKNLNLTDTVETPEMDFKAGLSECQLEDIDLLFAEIIQSNGLLTMDITRNSMSESMELLPLVPDSKMVKKVYDRVAYLKGKDLPSKLAQIEQQPPEQRAQAWLMLLKFKVATFQT